MTKEGWPVAHPRLSRRPSARMITPWPSGKMKRSHWGLMFCLLHPAKACGSFTDCKSAPTRRYATYKHPKFCGVQAAGLGS